MKLILSHSNLREEQINTFEKYSIFREGNSNYMSLEMGYTLTAGI